MNSRLQLEQIRLEQHQKYLKHLNEKIIQILANLAYKYRYLFNPTPIEKAARIIQKYIRIKFFHPDCINHSILNTIPAIYRLGIKFTNKHNPLCRDTDIKILFSYCFDIRNLYLAQNDPITINGTTYYLLPNDIKRLNLIYQRVNNNTDKSIIYLNNLEYTKSLAKDSRWNINTGDSIGQHLERIKKIFDTDADQTISTISTISEISEISKISKINKINDPEYFIVGGIKISNQYLTDLNRKYFSNQL